MGTVRHMLFIMCDQLRTDYLSCSGHPTADVSGGTLDEHLSTWLRTRRTRVTLTEGMVTQRTASARRHGMIIGEW